MENDIIEIKYAMDTFYFLISGVLVMWLAAGFTMLEAGLVRSKNTTEILKKSLKEFYCKKCDYKCSRKSDFINILRAGNIIQQILQKYNRIFSIGVNVVRVITIVLLYSITRKIFQKKNFKS